jgi:2-methylisocitrate lyase-like PEP mutase family enzyme
MTQRTQKEKGDEFRSLHEGARAFIIPNPWDAGTARMLTQMGFEALATTSAGNAFTLGLKDGLVGRDRTLANVAAIVAATELPVSGDLENGFGESPETVAETIRLAAKAGLAGGSIEDATGRPADPIYPIELAIERIEAAAEAARALPFRFTLRAGGSEGHDSSAANVPGGGRGRFVCAGTDDEGRDCGGDPLRRSSGECADGVRGCRS